MDELITISERRSVSARELYEKLGFNMAVWSRWAQKNIENNPFAIRGQDYESLNIMLSGEVSRVKGNFAKDYQLSIDFAKRLCMMAKTEKGEQIRNYFIEVEKRYQSGQMIAAPQIKDFIRKTIREEFQQFKQSVGSPIQLVIQQPEIIPEKRRAHSKMDNLSDDLRSQVHQMLDEGMTYQLIYEYLIQHDISISRSAFGRYAKEYLDRRKRLQAFREQTLALVPQRH